MNVSLVVEIASQETCLATLHISLYHLADKLVSFETTLEVEKNSKGYLIELKPPLEIPHGYGVEAILIREEGDVLDKATTAFDVQHTWTSYPRYGFLTDFTPNRQDIEQTLNWLTRFHVNGLQFYDWQYRHDTLVSPSETYSDPLERSLSLQTIREYIREARDHGVASMPYLAIYAASMEFWSIHPDWRLMDEHQQPILFEDFLGIMDPSPERPWGNHLLNECGRALSQLNFSGLHIDQYGDPKRGFRVTGEEINIPETFRSFISAANERFPEAALTFNAVGNWPIDTLAKAPLDFNYIEIWPPTPHYADLREIILESRMKSGNKPVVIALYLPSDRIQNIRLANAIIFASGGCRIELGENRRLLTDPYFPKHQGLSPELEEILRHYYDFAVRYADLNGPIAIDEDGLEFSLPEGIWGIPRKTDGWLILNLINMKHLEQARWDEEHPAPKPLDHFSLGISTPEMVKEIYWASPDLKDISLSNAKWYKEKRGILVEIPYLKYWTTVAIQFEHME
jgi:dextranase